MENVCMYTYRYDLMLLLGFLLLGIDDLVNFLCVSTISLALEVNDIGLYFLHFLLKALHISYSIPHYGSFVHLAMWMFRNASKTEKKIRPRCRKSNEVLRKQNVGIIDPTSLEFIPCPWKNIMRKTTLQTKGHYTRAYAYDTTGKP